MYFLKKNPRAMDGTVLQKRWGGSVYAKRIAPNVPVVYDVGWAQPGRTPCAPCFVLGSRYAPWTKAGRQAGHKTKRLCCKHNRGPRSDYRERRSVNKPVRRSKNWFFEAPAMDGGRASFFCIFILFFLCHFLLIQLFLLFYPLSPILLSIPFITNYCLFFLSCFLFY